MHRNTDGEKMDWVPCDSCGGSGSTRWFRGNSLTITHLARGGDPTKLPCGDCRGRGKVWGIVVDRPGGRRERGFSRSVDRTADRV